MKIRILSIGVILTTNSLFAAQGEPVEAHYTTKTIKLDGVLDEPIWKTAPTYILELPRNKQKDEQQVIESGNVQLAWNDTHLFFAFRFEDSDLIAEGLEDELHHYKLGDVAEVFLKPKNQTWYWEFYATPAGNKTSFFMPGRGRRGLESNFIYSSGLNVAAAINGTLNNWNDKDTGWTAEMAIPINDLQSQGDAFGPEAQWMIFFNRYNFSRYLPEKEQTMHPPLRNHDNHLYEDYSPLKLIR